MPRLWCHPNVSCTAATGFCRGMASKYRAFSVIPPAHMGTVECHHTVYKKRSVLSWPKGRTACFCGRCVSCSLGIAEKFFIISIDHLQSDRMEYSSFVPFCCNLERMQENTTLLDAILWNLNKYGENREERKKNRGKYAMLRLCYKCENPVDFCSGTW